MKQVIETLGPSGLYLILAWHGGIAATQSWWEGENFTPTECYERTDFFYDLVPEWSTAFYDGSIGIPLHMLIDRDGWVRKSSLAVVDQSSEITEWLDAIETLL